MNPKFNIGEIVYAVNVSTFTPEFEGQPCRIEGDLGLHEARNSLGNIVTITGCAVTFLGTGFEKIIMEDRLRRGNPQRYDLDMKTHWHNCAWQPEEFRGDY